MLNRTGAGEAPSYILAANSCL